ncbi:MAG: hypothetical protein JO061_16450 [Acidobacteriaceae bacterium]|nr:hypothetical protein [Acidobacteriaceae bacterium]
MSFSINTNISSLEAQNYLTKSSQFQSQTINEVTSGLRIVNSGDDAAGLAVANGLRSDEAVLNQGIQNANNGLATLQTIDSGMNNIGTLLDRARTLATESASGTFTGDRNTLNDEFQSVVSEITRQAQSIGMNQGGQYAQSLSVFIGGGKGATSAAASVNGSINLDLSKSAVDAQSLGLAGVQATGKAGTDIGTGSATTSVADILANTTNANSEATSGFTSFSFSGPGFGDANKVNISVNLSGVTDTTTLANAINSAIQSAGNGSTQYATAFKNANISASVVTDAQGRQQLAFSSSNAAFQVQAGDQMANALLGNFSVGSTGASLNTTVTGASATANNSTIVGAVLGSSTTISAGGSAKAVLTAPNTVADAYIASLNGGHGLGTAATAGNFSVALTDGNVSGANLQNSDTLVLDVNGTQKTVSWASAPTTVNGLMTAINNTAGVGVTASVSSGHLVITSNTPGASSAVAIDATSSSDVRTLLSGGTSTNGTAAVNDSLVLNVDGTNHTVTINQGTNSLSGIQTAINGASIGVTASITGSGPNQKLVLTDTTANTGSASNITVESTGTSAELLAGATGFSGGETADGAAVNTDLNVQVGSGSATEISLAAGTYTASQMVSQINTQLQANSVAATASLDTSGHLILTANTAGQSLALNTPTSSSAYSTLGLTAGTSTTAVVTSSDNMQVQFSGAGMASPVTLSLNPTVAGSTKVSDVLADLASKVHGNSQLSAAGVSVTTSSNGQNLVFTDSKGEQFNVAVTGDTNNVLGLGSFTTNTSSANAFQYSSITGNGAIPTTSALGQSGTLNVSLNGGATTAINVNLKNASGYVTGSAVGTGALAGLNTKTLVLDVDGASSPQTVTFGAGATSLASVVSAINGTAGIGVTASIVGSGASSALQLVSNTTGAASAVTIDGSSTATLSTLGLTVGQSGQGNSASAIATDAENQINAAVAANSTLSGAGLKASLTGGNALTLTSTNNSNFRVGGSGTANLGFGIGGGSYAGATVSAAPTVGRVDSQGAYTSSAMNFSALANGGDSQSVSITANDNSGGAHSLSISLQNNSTSTNGANIDSAINAINTALQQSNDSTLQSVYAVKEDNLNGTQSIKFQSTTQNFKVEVSSMADGTGIAAPTGGVSTAAQNGTGANAAIDSIPGAQAAVNALASAVQNLGTAQAAVGKGENLLNYAVSLATSQVTNEAASESQIRDANLAQEAANLSRAQILVQAGTAALAQANSAPQQLLSLLQH